nr:unnamed protein product [Callosobruchus chinensis]
MTDGWSACVLLSKSITQIMII